MPSYSTFTLPDADATPLVELLGREAMTTLPKSGVERWTRIQAKITDGRYVASNDSLVVMADLLLEVRGILRDTIAHNNRLNDPHGDDSGTDAQSPTGDDYNALLDIIQRLGRYSQVPLCDGPLDHKAVLRALLADGMKPSDVVEVLHERGTEKEGVSPEDAIRLAREQYAYPSEDNIEVDNNALFSETDMGLWVGAWLLLRNEELGLEGEAAA